MPLLQSSSYQRPNYLFNGHLETVYPAIFRQVELSPTSKERVETHDGDFLEIDWHQQGNSKLVVISHGLEGNSSRAYILGMANSGATYDLDTIIQHASPKYEEIFLIGFSLGGNLTLKYLGEKRTRIPKIKKGVAISVPLDLGSSCDQISKTAFGLYTKRFLKTLRQKVEKKAKLFPAEFDLTKFSTIQTLRDFDDTFTGPLHGFFDAEEYYQTNSSLQFLPDISVPTLVINAQNDPFLSKTCFPSDLAKKLDQVNFEFPKHGGHVGFMCADSNKTFYSETRAVEFICQDP